MVWIWRTDRFTGGVKLRKVVGMIVYLLKYSVWCVIVVRFLFVRMVLSMLYPCRIISVLFVTFKDDLNKTCGVSNTCRKLKMRIFMCEKRTTKSGTGLASWLTSGSVPWKRCHQRNTSMFPVAQLPCPTMTDVFRLVACITGSCLKQSLLLFAAVGSSCISTWETNKANEFNMLTLRGAWSTCGIMYRNTHCCRDTTQRHSETRHV